MVGNLLKNTESNGWGGGLDAPSPPSPPNLRDLGLWTLSGGPPAAGRGGEGVLSCETPGGATLCSINPLGGGFAAGLIWTLPTHAHAPGASPRAEGQTSPPLLGPFQWGRGFFSFTFIFY